MWSVDNSRVFINGSSWCGGDTNKDRDRFEVKMLLNLGSQCYVPGQEDLYFNLRYLAKEYISPSSIESQCLKISL